MNSDLRQVGDPPVDALLARHLGLSTSKLPSEIMAALRQRTDADANELQAWWAGPTELPTWAEPERIRRAQDYFARNGLAIGTALFCAALPNAYAAADGVAVLSEVSSGLGTNPRRRIAETARFLFAVTAFTNGDDTGRLALGDHATHAIRGVRLLHSIVRSVILDRDPPWPAEHGFPVNQEDLLGTMLTFTEVTRESMRVLGLVDDGYEDYLHLWSVVGHQLGVEHPWPMTTAEATELAARIRTTQHRPSQAGRDMAHALLVEMEQSMPIGMRKAPRTMVRVLAGDAVADTLGLPSGAWWRFVFVGVRMTNRFTAAVAPIRIVLRRVQRAMARAMLHGYVDRSHLDGTPFEVPDHLIKQWRLRVGRGRRLGRAGRRHLRARQERLERLGVTNDREIGRSHPSGIA
jgi:hypothetical protein